MPRKRRRAPLRTRITYYVVKDTVVVQYAGPRLIILGRTDPLLLTRKGEAEALARRAGGSVERLTKYRKFRPPEYWWA